MKLIDNVHFFSWKLFRIAKADKQNPAIRGRNVLKECLDQEPDYRGSWAFVRCSICLLPQNKDLFVYLGKYPTYEESFQPRGAYLPLGHQS